MEFGRKQIGSNSEEGLTAASGRDSNESAIINDDDKDTNLNDKSSSLVLKFITWNIEGLSRRYLKTRTEAVCKIIEKEQADVVFLQEVVPETAAYISERMSDYDCLFADEDDKEDKEGADEEDADKESAKEEEDEDDKEDEEDEEDEEEEESGYFVGTLLKKSSISLVDKEVIDFPLSVMSRNLLKINVTYENLPICLLNSHLESLLDFSEERKNQLRIIFSNMLEASEKETVIFGGDTNLREKELTEVGGIPAGIEDVWMTCGSQTRCAYTFDMTQNDNLKVNWKFKPKCRYDRVYFRRSSPTKLKPVFFGLIGQERLSPYRCFPSDHWGILCHFKRGDFKFKLDEGISENNSEIQILQPYWMRKL